jgi:dTDP-glucose pyrophosphorylase/predicted transcriptional regulator
MLDSTRSNKTESGQLAKNLVGSVALTGFPYLHNFNNLGTPADMSLQNWKKMLVRPGTSVLEALKVIDSTGHHCALVVDDDGKLKGVVTDGDVRRAILKHTSLTAEVSAIMNTNPHSVSIGASQAKITEIMRLRSIRQLPILDDQRRIVDVHFIDELSVLRKFENPVILMVGGEGKRLYPLTKDCPKPLLKLGDKPILEHIVENFVAQGFHNFVMSVNYKAEMIESHFGNGEQFNCNIRYLKEARPLGTAGSLSLLGKLDAPAIVMNGDILTKTNFAELLTYHTKHEASATMCVRPFELQVPYGVISAIEDRISQIDEKPVHTFFVNGGIYVLNPETFSFLESKEVIDMPSFFQRLIHNGHKVSPYLVREYWLDVGQFPDFERARQDFERFFS